MTNAICIVPRYNSAGKRDVTGAFLPEAKRFAKLHGILGAHVVSFDNTATKSARRKEVEALIWETSSDLYDVVAVFCHGTRRELQTGHSTTTMQGLAEVIAMRSVPEVRVPLYCCSTGSVGGEDERQPGPGGDGGPADVLRDWLSTEGCSGGWVDGHTTVAHTTKNPHVRRFYTVGNRTGDKVDVAGGDWLVAPGSPEWRRWVAALKTDMRFRFPTLSVAEIRGAL